MWSNANDISPSNPSTKAIVTMTCPDEIEALCDAVTARLNLGNFAI